MSLSQNHEFKIPLFAMRLAELKMLKRLNLRLMNLQVLQFI